MQKTRDKGYQKCIWSCGTLDGGEMIMLKKIQGKRCHLDWQDLDIRNEDMGMSMGWENRRDRNKKACSIFRKTGGVS